MRQATVNHTDSHLYLATIHVSDFMENQFWKITRCSSGSVFGCRGLWRSDNWCSPGDSVSSLCLAQRMILFCTRRKNCALQKSSPLSLETCLKLVLVFPLAIRCGHFGHHHRLSLSRYSRNEPVWANFSVLI